VKVEGEVEIKVKIKIKIKERLRLCKVYRTHPPTPSLEKRRGEEK
jgi:hypothetical protein